MATRPKIVHLVIGLLLTVILPASAQGPGPLPDSAHFRGGDAQLPVSTMIDGTVQSMNANILIIDGMSVQVAPNTRLLNVIRIGDLVYAEDNLVADGDTPCIVAVYQAILDMDVAVNDDGVVRRDAGDCRNLPSLWAPATGWRQRCGGATGATGSQGVGDSGMGGE